MGNWDSYQITQLNHVVQPTDSEQALSECLLTLSKHLVNRIDSIRAARLQAAYFRAFSRGRSTHGPRSPTPLFQTSVGSCFPTICFLCGTPGSWSWDLFIVERSKTSYHRHPVRCQAFLHEEEGRGLNGPVNRARRPLIRGPN